MLFSISFFNFHTAFNTNKSCYDSQFTYPNLSKRLKLMKGKSLRKKNLHGKTAASVF